MSENKDSVISEEKKGKKEQIIYLHGSPRSGRTTFWKQLMFISGNMDLLEDLEQGRPCDRLREDVYKTLHFIIQWCQSNDIKCKTVSPIQNSHVF